MITWWRRLRWRLVLALVPFPIMRSPFGEEPTEVYILMRSEGTVQRHPRYVLTTAVKATTLEMKMESNLAPLAYDNPATEPFAYRPHRQTGTFSGTIG